MKSSAKTLLKGKNSISFLPNIQFLTKVSQMLLFYYTNTVVAPCPEQAQTAPLLEKSTTELDFALT